MVKLSCIDVDEQEDLALQVSLSPFSKTKKSWKRSKDMLDKTSKEESEYQNIDDDGDDNNEEQDEEKSSRIAFCDLEKLPERIQRVGMRTISKEMTRRSFALYS